MIPPCCPLVAPRANIGAWFRPLPMLLAVLLQLVAAGLLVVLLLLVVVVVQLLQILLPEILVDYFSDPYSPAEMPALPRAPSPPPNNNTTTITITTSPPGG